MPRLAPLEFRRLLRRRSTDADRDALLEPEAVAEAIWLAVNDGVGARRG